MLLELRLQLMRQLLYDECTMRCFVIMPFGEKEVNGTNINFDTLYSEWIKPVVEEARLPEHGVLSCHRVDETCLPGDVLDEILRGICDSEIVIADLTGGNPNVFYELGIRHAVRNGTVLIRESHSSLPFNLAGQRALSYNYTPDGMVQFKRNLRRILDDLLENPNRIDNAVRQYLHKQESKRLEERPIPPSYNPYAEIVKEIAQMRQDFARETRDVREMVRAVTSEYGLPQSAESVQDALALLEGVWRDSYTGTIVCVRLIGEHVVAPYSYGDSGEADAFLFNVRRMSDLLFARFKWLRQDTHGYLTLRVQGVESMVGGWWLGEPGQEPTDHRSILRYVIPLVGSVRMALQRIGNVSDFPGWAVSYIRDWERGLPHVDKDAAT